MKRKFVLCSILISMGLLLTGCTNAFDHMPDLTEEESRLIAEYAASIMIKHDKYAGRLVSDAEIAAADERAERLRNSAEQYAAAQEEETDEDGTEQKPEGGSEASAQTPAEEPFAGIAQFCGLEGFEITYVGYTVCDFYPPEDSEELVFAMDASPGNKLLVLQFMVENQTAEDRELDMLSRNIRFRIAVNDEGAQTVLSTLLLDDMASYKGIVPAGTASMMVLVREIPEAEAGAVSTISLSMRGENGSAETVLAPQQNSR